MANKRIFWAVQAVGVAPLGSLTFTEVHGLQTIGMTTTFNLEQVFEIGQIAIYENIENIPDVEMTLEKVIDGYPLAYHLATSGYINNTLSGRQNQRSIVALSVFDDTGDSASGDPITEVQLSGMYVSSLSYNFPVEGNCTESLTLVGNNKVIKTSAFDFEGQIFDNTDQPLALTQSSGGVQRRENVIFDVQAAGLDANGQVDTVSATILPPDIDGISSSGTNFLDSEGQRGAHVQNITVSTDLGREEIFELGRRSPYFRFVTFPVEVTTEIETIAVNGDRVEALEEQENLTDRSIRVKLTEGLFVNTGLKNKLSSVTYGGGDAGGGNATITYSYTTFNEMKVTHPQDPG